MTLEEMNRLLASLRVGDVISVPVHTGSNHPCADVWAGHVKFSSTDGKCMDLTVDIITEDVIRTNWGPGREWYWTRQLSIKQWEVVSANLHSYIQFEEDPSNDFEEE